VQPVQFFEGSGLAAFAAVDQVGFFGLHAILPA
jgi:hypothetical protein